MVDRGIAEAIAALPCWSGFVEVAPLSGGLTNHNYLVTDGRHQKFVVRRGQDIPVHGIMRFNELAAAQAAFAAGIGPQVVHASAGFMVIRFVAGTVLTPALVRSELMLRRISDLLRRCHRTWRTGYRRAGGGWRRPRAWLRARAQICGRWRPSCRGRGSVA